MSWIARSLANSLNLHEEEDDDPDNIKTTHTTSQSKDDPDSHSDSRGVKEDLSDLTKSLTRQLWGVASFLAPPPSDSSNIEVSGTIYGIRNDFAEIGGRFRTGISKLSSNKTVSEIAKIATDILQLGPEEGDLVQDYGPRGVVGVTDEIVLFVRSISMHPGTWLDFPLQNGDDLNMSEVQQEHALAVERLAPTLADLRIELCPEYMSEAHFWKIYFLLLHSKLSKEDAELLSTTQILEARQLLLHELHNRNTSKLKSELPEVGTSDSKETVDSQYEELLFVSPKVSKPESTTVPDTESQIINKSAGEEQTNQSEYKISYSGSSYEALDNKCDEDDDGWLTDDNSEAVDKSGLLVPIEDDVSFSDLEDDANENAYKSK